MSDQDTTTLLHVTCHWVMTQEEATTMGAQALRGAQCDTVENWTGVGRIVPCRLPPCRCPVSDITAGIIPYILSHWRRYTSATSAGHNNWARVGLDICVLH
jgi:hypothetical protein